MGSNPTLSANRGPSRLPVEMNEAPSYTSFETRRIGGALGAVLSGLDLSRPLSDLQFEELEHALVRYEVVFFRDQELSAEQQLALAARFGEISLYPIEKFFGSDSPGHQVVIDDAENPPGTDLWHTDVSWLPRPPKVALLTVLEVPTRGGDTLWLSTTAAYQALSPKMRAFFDDLEAVHSCWTTFVEIAERKSGIEGLADRLRAAYPEVVHPLVRTHPDSGKRLLYLTDRGVMNRIAGMQPEESEALLDFLGRHLEQPRFQVRWHWRPGDLAIWDERSTLHRGVSDHFPQRRVIRRCTVDGEVPFFDASRQPTPDYQPA